jgi:hypothetical protein
VKTLRRYATVGAIIACAMGATMLPATAQAEYNGQYYYGCTYSWGAACVGPYQHLENVYTMDSDLAWATMAGRKPANGYKQAEEHAGESRDVCASYENPYGTVAAAWSCNWGGAYTEPHAWGYPTIGTVYEYYNISMYQWVNSPS